MKRMTLLFVSFFVLVFFSGCSDNKTLDRSRAEKIFKDQGFLFVVLQNDLKLGNRDAQKLFDNNYLSISDRDRERFVPTRKIMPYFTNDRTFVGFSGREYNVGANLMSGKVTRVKSTGIEEKDVNNKIVYFDLELEPNEVGEILGLKRNMPLVVSFKLFDDGWRMEKILWEETNKSDKWVDQNVTGFHTEIDYINQALWSMHEKQLYSENYKEFLAKLEKSDYPNYLDTVAWVYKDNGNKNKAISIYENRLMPMLKKMGDNDVMAEYEKLEAEIRR